MNTYTIIHINWDTDGLDPASLGLPTHVGRIEADSPDDLADLLSDQYGWCVLSVFHMQLPITAIAFDENGASTERRYG